MDASSNFVYYFTEVTNTVYYIVIQGPAEAHLWVREFFGCVEDPSVDRFMLYGWVFVCLSHSPFQFSVLYHMLKL